ncbi:MAG: SCO family protein [Rhodospirillales bacterium]|nr:SCO family protein [Rhodospirillales bacterium]
MKLSLTTRAATVVLTVVAMVAMTWAALTWYEKPRPAVTVGANATRPGTGAAAIEIGGPFELVAHTGETISDAAFRGRFMLVFFGYTFCPDVCPTELLVMSQALDLLGEKGEAVQPILITVDPERDTAEALAEYVGNFHPRLIGLTGTEEQIAAAAKAYRAFYAKAFYPASGGTEDARDGQTTEAQADDYLMNHSAFTYLMGPDGGYRTVFPHKTSPEDMAKAIAAELEKTHLATGG